MNQAAHAQGDLNAPARCCVVLTGSTDQKTKELIAGLEKRRLQAVAVKDETQVMVALGEVGAKISVLIIDEPDRHKHVAELIRAVRRYYPRTLCWQYESAGRGLVPINPRTPDPGPRTPDSPPDPGLRTPDSGPQTPLPDPGPWSQSASGGPDPAPTEKSSPARLTGADHWLDLMRDDEPAPRPTSELATPPELTEQELAMLLGRESDPRSFESTELDDDQH